MVQLGQVARLAFAGLEGKSVSAKATFVAPTLDEATRTLKVRFEIDNPDRKLRPGSIRDRRDGPLARARARGARGGRDSHRPARPSSSSMHAAHAEPREVTPWARSSGAITACEAGLEAGERVATGAQFLLDSESRLRATSAPGGGHAGH